MATGEGVDVLEADFEKVLQGLGVEGAAVAGHDYVVELVDAHAGDDGVCDAPVDEGDGVPRLGHHVVVPPNVGAESCNPVFGESTIEGLFVYDAGAGDVNEVSSRIHQLKCLLVDQLVGGGHPGHAKLYKVGVTEDAREVLGAAEEVES